MNNTPQIIPNSELAYLIDMNHFVCYSFQFSPGKVHEVVGYGKLSGTLYEDIEHEDVTHKKEPESPFTKKLKKVYQGAIKGWKDKARK